MWFCKLVILFMVFSLAGWVYESIFAIIKLGKWDRRGFLYGPVCPIYGVGGLGVILLAYLVGGFPKEGETVLSVPLWGVFLISFVACTILEYVTHYALEKMFHAYWWDYSDMPFHFQGRICLPASIMFGFAGVLGVYVLAPMCTWISPLFNPIAAEIISFGLFGIFIMDLTLTLSALTDFENKISHADEYLNSSMENLVTAVHDKLVPTLGEEEEEALLEQRMAASVSRMPDSYRRAIGRIQGFTVAQTEKGKRRLERFLGLTKEKVRRDDQESRERRSRKK